MASSGQIYKGAYAKTTKTATRANFTFTPFRSAWKLRIVNNLLDEHYYERCGMSGEKIYHHEHYQTTKQRNIDKAKRSTKTKCMTPP